MGTPPSGRGPSMPRRPSARKELVDSITEVRIRYLYLDCQLTVLQIARRYNVSVPTIHDRLRHFRIPLRPRGKKLDRW